MGHLELLTELTEAVGISGQEGEVRRILRRHLQGHAEEIYTDKVGNLIARKGSGPLRVVIEGHTDEVGGMVSGYHADGYLKVKWHGLGADVLMARRVWVGTRRLPGVVGARALHLSSRAELDKYPDLDDLLVDIGARNQAEAERRVDYGDPVVFATRCEPYGERVIKAKAIDNRAGCALALLAFAAADFAHLTLYAVFAAMEEVGTRGTMAYATALQPHVGVVLEATAAGDGPGVGQPRASAVMGDGPVLSLVDNRLVYSTDLRAALERVAAAQGIPVQHRRLTTAANDAGALATAGAGAHALAISLPARYIHSPAALMDLQDFDHARRLLLAFLAALDRGEVSL